ncbi:MAG: ABC transporter type 1, transmembrane domain-containing protein [Monoraphidium minutum]|nr:MAG: ABC transporter type 1, transmembrane domain-containing protein [Monoraphidium minutum]
MAMDVQVVFPIATAAASLATLVLLFMAVRSAAPSTAADERKFRGFKYVRVGTYGALAALQAALIAARQWEHWPMASAVDADGACVWLLYLITLVVLVRRNRLGLRISGIVMLTMLQVGLLLAQDAAPPAGGGAPGELFDGERIARVSLHGLQLVMLLALLVCEVIIQQHQLLAAEDGAYEPLMDAEAAGGGKRWRPGDGRMAMAMGAFRYVWPSAGMLRARLLACFVLVMIERGVNLAVPILFKNMVEALSALGEDDAAPGGNAAPAAAALRRLASGLASALGLGAGGGAGGEGGAFWGLFYPWAFFYLGTLFLRGGAGGEGLLADVRDILWIPITQAAFRRISLDVFGHLLALDLHWHLHRKTGQVMRILDRGTTSIQDTVSIVLFNVLPSMVDIIVACSYLAGRMEPWVALIVLVTVSSYVPLTVLITERRGKVRKVMNALDNEREGRATDVLLNYETVKYFGNEAFELAGYDTATRKYQAAEYWQMVFLSLLSMVQSSVVWVGMAAGLAVCVRGVARGTLTVGDTVLFVTMMQQLYVPLTFFGSYYRQVQKALIDMENMFELLATDPRTRDGPGAPPLRVTAGRVDFRDVVFGYHTHSPVLKGVSFGVPGATTLAVVGSTGSGKSTILRLLLRFYDPQSGGVFIDGSNIRHASQASVRAAIAVVPQTRRCTRRPASPTSTSTCCPSRTATRRASASAGCG